jgi:hypothetical protein
MVEKEVGAVTATFSALKKEEIIPDATTPIDSLLRRHGRCGDLLFGRGRKKSARDPTSQISFCRQRLCHLSPRLL